MKSADEVPERFEEVTFRTDEVPFRTDEVLMSIDGKLIDTDKAPTGFEEWPSVTRETGRRMGIPS